MIEINKTEDGQRGMMASARIELTKEGGSDDRTAK